MLRAFFLLIFLGLFLSLQSSTVRMPVQHAKVLSSTQEIIAQHPKKAIAPHPKVEDFWPTVGLVLFCLAFPFLLFIAAQLTAYGFDGAGSTKPKFFGYLNIGFLFAGMAAWVAGIVFLFFNPGISLLLCLGIVAVGLLFWLISAILSAAWD